MAQSERFYYWRSIHEQMMKLSDEAAGRYIKAIGRWAFEGEDTRFDDAMLDFAWPTIRDQVRESVAIGVQNSDNGKRGGRPKSGGFSGGKTGGFGGGKSGGKTAAENARKSARKSVEKRSERKSSEVNFSSSAAPAASGGAGASSENPFDPPDPITPEEIERATAEAVAAAAEGGRDG